MGTVLSVFVGGAVLPVAFVLFWGGCTALGACMGTLLGGICGVIAWVVTAQKMYVSASVLSLQNNEPVLAGCCCGVGIAAIVCIAIVSISTNLLVLVTQSWHVCRSCIHKHLHSACVSRC